MGILPSLPPLCVVIRWRRRLHRRERAAGLDGESSDQSRAHQPPDNRGGGGDGCSLRPPSSPPVVLSSSSPSSSSAISSFSSASASPSASPRRHRRCWQHCTTLLSSRLCLMVVVCRLFRPIVLRRPLVLSLRRLVVSCHVAYLSPYCLASPSRPIVVPAGGCCVSTPLPVALSGWVWCKPGWGKNT
jgi:hypothetical protein